MKTIKKNIFIRVICITYVFISLEITFFKNFKKYILNWQFFTNCLYLFTINEIYFINKESKKFCKMYKEIKKKKIPYHIFLLKVSAIMTKLTHF